MKQCVGCGQSFAPNNNKQKYCSILCRDRIKRKKYRILRQAQGRCPQCNGPMDYPVSKHQTKQKIQHCSRCREYYRQRHQQKKSE